MGTTLTGTTPQTTYDSLIKVTDNGPLGGSLKTLTDGLGNDSALALSTGAASVTGTLSVSNTLTLSGYGSGTKTGTAAYNLAVDSSGNVIETAGGVVDGSGTANYVSKWSDPNTLTNSLIYDNGSAVGIGTTSPSSSFKLTVNSGSNINSFLNGNKISFSRTSDNAFDVAYLSRTNDLGVNGTANIHGYDGIQFRTQGPESVKATITSAGNVGIGTSSPTQKLTVNGNAAVGGQQAFWLRDDDGFSSGVTRRAWAITANYATLGTFSIYGASAANSDPLAGTPFLNITSAGNVGIGTSSPAYKLHVDGAFGTSSGAYISGSTYGMLGVNRGASNASAGVQYYNIGSQKWFAGIYENTDNFGFYSVGTSSFPMVIEYSTGNVGIGTTSPSYKLQVEGAGRFSNGASGTLIIKHNYFFQQPNWGIKLDGDTGSSGGYLSQYIDIGGFELAQGATYYGGGPWLADSNSTTYSAVVGNGGTLIFSTNSGLTAGGTFFPSERMRITSDGNVGIGTSSPTSKLVVNGDIATSGNIALTGSGAGIFLGGSIGSANGLDDYEEGTWTMGFTFGGASVGVTYSNNTGTYTKIGRQVTVNGLIQLSNKGSSTGGVRITGLPFNVANTNGNYSQSSLRVKNISFLNAYQGYAEINTTTVVLEQVTNLGVVTAITDIDFANNSEIIISLTYFV